jgi:hypothetical protein
MNVMLYLLIVPFSLDTRQCGTVSSKNGTHQPEFDFIMLNFLFDWVFSGQQHS